MTSNSPEHSNPADRGTGRPSGGGGNAGGPAGSGVPVTPARGSEPAGRPSVQGARTPVGKDSEVAKKPRNARDTTSRKQGSSGGDWSVFRTVVVLVGLVIAAFGVYYLILGTAGLPDTEGTPVNPTLENQFRFFSAMMVGVGAAFITIAIKFQWANMLWLVCLMVFIGGIGRVLSWAFSGTPNYVLIVLMVVELAFPPALLVWHKYIAKTSELRQEYADRG